MHTTYVPNNYLSNLSLYIKLHRYIYHDGSWQEHKTKSNYTIWNIYKGTIWIEINHQIYQADAGDVIIFYPGDTYKAYTDEAGCYFLFFIFSLQQGNQIDVLNSSRLSGFYHHRLVKKRCLEFIEHYIQQFYERENSILKLYSFFLDYIADLTDLSLYAYLFNNDQTSTDSPLIHQILNYMNEHYTEDITVIQLAEKFSMSEKNFIRYFHFNTGIPPKRYLIEQRMKYAIELLSDQDYSISKISQIVGYSDPYIFSKAFHKYYGESPSTYRKSLAETPL